MRRESVSKRRDAELTEAATAIIEAWGQIGLMLPRTLERILSGVTAFCQAYERAIEEIGQNGNTANNADD